jgi:hydroxymethylglutaryl-CoA lyase
MDNFVTIFEMSPRDGLQNEKKFISTNDKLSLCGFKKIETSSFVSSRWVPQLADASEVFIKIKRNKNIKYTALTPNEIGLHNAIKSKVDEIAIFAAASETFSQKNINCDIKTSLLRFKPLVVEALKKKIPVRGYISCVSHCPYEDTVDPKKVAQIAKQLIEMGCYEVSLGDTTGKGNPDQTIKIVNECLTFTTPDKLAGHFHDTFKNALDNIRVCLDHGIRTFDSSVGGLGGCPYSPGSKGNVATEKVNELLLSLGYETKLNTKRINECAEIALKLKMDGTYD